MAASISDKNVEPDNRENSFDSGDPTAVSDLELLFPEECAFCGKTVLYSDFSFQDVAFCSSRCAHHFGVLKLVGNSTVERSKIIAGIFKD